MFRFADCPSEPRSSWARSSLLPYIHTSLVLKSWFTNNSSLLCRNGNLPQEMPGEERNPFSPLSNTWASNRFRSIMWSRDLFMWPVHKAAPGSVSNPGCACSWAKEGAMQSSLPGDYAAAQHVLGIKDSSGPALVVDSQSSGSYKQAAGNNGARLCT